MGVSKCIQRIKSDVLNVVSGEGTYWGIKYHVSVYGSGFKRTGGSIGMCAYPGRVLAGKKMPGQMGNKQRTTQNLKVVELNIEGGYVLIKGSIPGSTNGIVRVSKSIKK